MGTGGNFLSEKEMWAIRYFVALCKRMKVFSDKVMKDWEHWNSFFLWTKEVGVVYSYHKAPTLISSCFGLDRRTICRDSLCFFPIGFGCENFYFFPPFVWTGKNNQFRKLFIKDAETCKLVRPVSSTVIYRAALRETCLPFILHSLSLSSMIWCCFLYPSIMLLKTFLRFSSWFYGTHRAFHFYVTVRNIFLISS